VSGGTTSSDGKHDRVLRRDDTRLAGVLDNTAVFGRCRVSDWATELQGSFNRAAKSLQTSQRNRSRGFVADLQHRL